MTVKSLFRFRTCSSRYKTAASNAHIAPYFNGQQVNDCFMSFQIPVWHCIVEVFAMTVEVYSGAFLGRKRVRGGGSENFKF